MWKTVFAGNGAICPCLTSIALIQGVNEMMWEYCIYWTFSPFLSPLHKPLIWLLFAKQLLRAVFNSQHAAVPSEQTGPQHMVFTQMCSISISMELGWHGSKIVSFDLPFQNRWRLDLLTCRLQASVAWCWSLGFHRLSETYSGSCLSQASKSYLLCRHMHTTTVCISPILLCSLHQEL